MKNSVLILSSVLTLVFLISCGKDGIDGRDGIDGQDAATSKIIDVEGDFTAGNNYRIFHEFRDSNLEVLETDVVLVYIKWDQVNGSDGQPINIWRLLPQTRILNQGLLVYNYEHSFVDVDIFLESDFDLDTLLPGDTSNQIFRIAVVPAENTSKSSLDKHNINTVMNTLGVEEKDIRKIKLD